MHGFYEEYTGTISGPSTLGPGDKPVGPLTGTGDIVGISYSLILGVPYGYVSGATLSDADFYAQMSFNDIGILPGTYIYTWGSGPTADSLTIQIGVPEPATLGALAGPAALALLRRRRISL